MNRRDFFQGSLSAAVAASLTAGCSGSGRTPAGDRSGAVAGDIAQGRRIITREEVAGERGAIGAGNALTAATGARILARGGNAIDAAIAAAFMAYVVEPAQAGLGGHGRLTVHMAKNRRTVGIDHYIRAPSGATPAAYTEALRRLGQDTTRITHTGHLAVGVFGTVAGLCTAHAMFASMPLAELMEEAIAMAEVGPPVDLGIQRSIVARLHELEGFPRAREALLPGGQLPALATEVVRGKHGWERTGPRLDTRDLAQTMKRIAMEGASAIYTGSIAEAIDREMRENFGVLTAADLASYKPAVLDETLFTYRDHSYSTCSDLLGPQFLNIVEHFDLASLDPDGADYRHIVAEALALAFADAFHFPADPAALDAPREGLVSKEYGRLQASRISLERAIGRNNYTPGDPWQFETRAVRTGQELSTPRGPLSGTTSITVGDWEGNLVSFITSLGSGFGSLVLVPGTGIFLGNAMQWFDPRPGLANSIAPGRMPIYSAPLMTLFQNARPTGAIAAAGGFRIPAAMFHPLLNRVDHRMSIQAALEHPRLHTQGEDVVMEERVGRAVIEEMEARGHTVQVLVDAYESSIGRPTAVWRHADGAWYAAADPIAGGTAAVS